MATNEELVAIIRADISDFKEKMAQVSAQTKKTETTFSGLEGIFVKLTGAVATAVTVWKSYETIMNSSSAGASELEIRMSGLTTAWNEVLRSISNMQFTDFINSIDKAKVGGEELANSLINYRESLMANGVLEAKEIDKLKELEEVWRNRDNSLKDRKTALDEWVVLKKEANQRELNVEQQLNMNLVKTFGERTGLNAKELQQFVTIKGAYSTVIPELEKLEIIKTRLSNQLKYGNPDKEKELELQTRLNDQYQIVSNLLQGSGISVKKFGELLRAETKMSGKEIELLSKSFASLFKATGGANAIDAMVARIRSGLTDNNLTSNFDATPGNKILQYKEYFLTIKEAIKEIKPSIDAMKVSWQQFGDTIERLDVKGKFKDIKQITIDIAKELEYLAEGALVAFAEGFGSVLAGGSMKQALNGMLVMFADWASNLGKIIIAAGLAIEGIKKWALANPLAAVGLGVALVATAAAIRGAVNKSPIGSGSGGGSSSGGGGNFDIEGFRNLRGLEIAVTGVITGKGSDLQAIIRNESNRKAL